MLSATPNYGQYSGNVLNVDLGASIYTYMYIYIYISIPLQQHVGLHSSNQTHELVHAYSADS